MPHVTPIHRASPVASSNDVSSASSEMPWDRLPRPSPSRQPQSRRSLAPFPYCLSFNSDSFGGALIFFGARTARGPRRFRPRVMCFGGGAGYRSMPFL